jgi:predicted MFS family arabinose efflux permease
VSIGSVAGVPAGALVGELLGWRTAFFAAAGITAVVLAGLLATVPSIAPQPGADLRHAPKVLKNRKAQLGLVAAILVFIGQFAAYTYISPFLDFSLGISPAALSLVLLGYGAAGFLGNLVGGWAAARSVKAAVVATGLTLGLSILLLLALRGAFAPSIAVVLVWGFGFGLLPIALQSWMFSAAPDRLEVVGALFVSIAQAAIGTGALLGGLLVDHLGVSSALWLGGAGALASAALLALHRTVPARP